MSENESGTGLSPGDFAGRVPRDHPPGIAGLYHEMRRLVHIAGGCLADPQGDEPRNESGR